MAEKTIHRQYVLDAGALIARVRRDPKVAALMEVAAEHRIEMILPSAVLAQVWRDGARQAILSRMLRNPGKVTEGTYVIIVRGVAVPACGQPSTTWS